MKLLPTTANLHNDCLKTIEAWTKEHRAYFHPDGTFVWGGYRHECSVMPAGDYDSKSIDKTEPVFVVCFVDLITGERSDLAFETPLQLRKGLLDNYTPTI